MKNFTILLVCFGLFSFRALAQFSSVTSLNSLSVNENTAAKPQSKVWKHDGKFWAVLSNSNGTYIWVLDGKSWKNKLKLTSDKGRADCKVVGKVVHILLFQGSSSELYSAEYDNVDETYKPWSKRKSRSKVSLDSGVETATIDIDTNGRMWLASDSKNKINVRWSDSPYEKWSSPITLADNITDDDISSVIAFPNSGQIGVFWSNQKTEDFGFKMHTDGASPSSWSSDEKPGSKYAKNVGDGFADDHMNLKLGSNGTLYVAMKTSYDKSGYPRLGLLVRRPTGSWDKLYEVSEKGTRAILVLNEAADKMRVIYTEVEDGGDILYRESRISSIDFGKSRTLIKGTYNDATSSKDSYAGSTIIIASSNSKAVSILGTDQLAAPEPEMVAPVLQPELAAFPNPFFDNATLKFTMPETGEYTIALYDAQGNQSRILKHGTAEAGEAGIVEVDAHDLPRGLYVVRLQTAHDAATLRVMHEK
ncbi:T9SS type A sorting domain-containing protein [Adhaeribacter soli]|uniref:T9SS type A sorting domain-containing protein n=1 Tax=Adhaeribacter soli TaxID=2607655 RepID=A0A5N1J3W3_9BACT|nr:T9SS type A sorting domain-containing protein [Adhaeribacter soli]KAA9345591.1 T9SS type A sorting domain-containing protein [Adhaeribacter soli]